MTEYTIPDGHVYAMRGGSKGFVTGGLYNAGLVLEGVEFASGTEAVRRIIREGVVLD